MCVCEFSEFASLNGINAIRLLTSNITEYLYKNNNNIWEKVLTLFGLFAFMSLHSQTFAKADHNTMRPECTKTASCVDRIT